MAQKKKASVQEADVADAPPKVDAASTQYLVQSSSGNFVIEIKDNQSVTFGAVNPGAQGQYADRNLHCLRVWEGTGNNKKLRAVFCDIRSIRDMSIPYAKEIRKETGSSRWEHDSAGNFSHQEDRKVERHYLNPGDEPDMPF